MCQRSGTDDSITNDGTDFPDSKRKMSLILTHYRLLNITLGSVPPKQSFSIKPF